MSDLIVVMRNAEIAQAGTPEELYERPDSIFVATFMGEANHMRGSIEAIAGDDAMVALDVLRLTLPHRGLPVGPVDVVVRPEAITIGEAGAPGMAGRILRATYMGSHTECVVATPLGEMLAFGPKRLARLAAGATVSVSFDPEGVVLVRP